jgi:Rod binding domain-containing protein
METLAAYLPELSAGNSLSSAARKKTHQAAQDFEAVFIAEMIRPIFDELTEEQNPLTGGGGYEQQVYNSFLVDQLGKSVAQRGGVGIAANVERELLKLQEIGHGTK